MSLDHSLTSGARDRKDSLDGCDTTEVPARFAKEIAARRRLHERCPVDIYVAGVNPRFSWPHRLVSAREANRPALRDACQSLIVDSVMQDTHYPVRDVLDAAAQIGADHVVMKDYPDDPGITLDAYERFMSFYTRHDCDANVIPVISPEHVRRQWRIYACGSPEHRLYGIGGMKDYTPERQVSVLREARDIVDDSVRLHAFGIGTSTEVIHALRKSAAKGRPLIDSLDISTPENAVGRNKLPDKRWNQHRVPLPSGTDSTTVRAGFAEAVARMLVYELTPECDDDLFTTAGVSTLGE